MASIEMVLSEVEEDKLDIVLSLNEMGKTIFFDNLITTFYPHIEKDSEEYNILQNNYRSCWMVEKIYRNNVFFKKSFSIIYTKTGLTREIANDLYYTDDTLIIH